MSNKCRPCQKFFLHNVCLAASYGECDCPKCQRLCECKEENEETPAVVIHEEIEQLQKHLEAQIIYVHEQSLKRFLAVRRILIQAGITTEEELTTAELSIAALTDQVNAKIEIQNKDTP